MQWAILLKLNGAFNTKYVISCCQANKLFYILMTVSFKCDI